MNLSLFGFKAVYRLRRAAIRTTDRWLNILMRGHVGSNADWAASYRDVGELASESNERWTTRAWTGPSLTVVIVTYKNPDALRCTIAAFECQTLKNFDLIVLHDGADEATGKVIQEYKSNYPASKIKYLETETRYNDWGHTLRHIGIQQATGDFLLITNGDNYYCPRFTEFVFDAIQSENLDMVMWNFVHSHSKPGNTPLPAYSPFESFPLALRMDIGSIMVRTGLAKQVGFRDRSHDADAAYMKDILELKQPLRIGKIEKTLMVHN